MRPDTLAQHTEDCLPDGALALESVRVTAAGEVGRRGGMETLPGSGHHGPHALAGGIYRLACVGNQVVADAV